MANDKNLLLYLAIALFVGNIIGIIEGWYGQEQSAMYQFTHIDLQTLKVNTRECGVEAMILSNGYVLADLTELKVRDCQEIHWLWNITVSKKGFYE